MIETAEQTAANAQAVTMLNDWIWVKFHRNGFRLFAAYVQECEDRVKFAVKGPRGRGILIRTRTGLWRRR